MAWRFKTSKYKNAAPSTLKREDWIGDIQAGNLMQCSGNHIKASCVYMAFNVDFGGGGNLGVLPVSTAGRLVNGLPLLPAHGDFVTDFDFSPFDDYLLATGSADNMVKVWLLPEDENLSSSSFSALNPCAVLPAQDKRIENVLWNPVAEGVLAVTSHNSLKLFDVESQIEKCAINCHKDQIQSMSWRGNGQELVTSCKDKQIRIVDPRVDSAIKESAGHQNIKDSRALWLGDKDFILTTGFGASRDREVKLWDSRNMSSSISSINTDRSTGTLIPLFDPDTNMLFLAGKGDSTVSYLELSEKQPYLTTNSENRVEQIKGMGMVPKRALNVMSGEVNKLLVVTKHAILPLSYIVPRKNYHDFHEDLFPDTPSDEPTVTAEMWFSGQNGQRNYVSLNPSRRPPNGQRRGALFQPKGSNSSKPVSNGTTSSSGASKESTPDTQTTAMSKLGISSKSDASKLLESTANTEEVSEMNQTDEEKADHHNHPDTSIPETSNDVQQPSAATAKVFTGIRQSKYKHLTAKVLHRSNHIENIRRVDRTIPGESDFFAANKTRCVVPIEGAGGLLSVFELNKPGKLSDTGLPMLQHQSKVMDYAWDPFDDSRLVTVCDNTRIVVWDLPKDGLTESLTEPDTYLLGHSEKVYFVRFHPVAKDIIVTSAYDFTVRIWNIAEMEEVIRLDDHPDQVFCAAWSPDGKYLCTVCKDGKIRIFNVRKSPSPLLEGAGPHGSRGARAVFVLDGQYLVVTGFDSHSSRILSLYDTGDLSKPLATVDLSVAPSILIPFYDEDSKTVFVTGRGDGLVSAFEVMDEEPYIYQLADSKFGGQHQAFSFLPKNQCNVKDIEFAKALRLTFSTVEPVSFRVPRVRPQYFQDDLFPDTKVTWEPTMSAKEWLAGANSQSRTVSLKPKDMMSLSEAPVEAPKPKKFESYNPESYKTDEQKKDELMSAMTKKLGHHEDPLPQDLAEGVDEEEWDDY